MPENMSPAPPTRSERRKAFDDKVRLSLLEDDADSMERMFSQVAASQSRIQSLLWGVMSTLLIAVVLLALNLAVGEIPVPGS